MRNVGLRKLALGLVVVGGVATSFGAVAADLPKSTQAILKKLEMQPDILNGLDKELNVPQEWLDKAKAEGSIKVLGTWTTKQFGELSAPFRERYPFIKINYSDEGTNSRVLKPLIAYKAGRNIADIITGIGESVDVYHEAQALQNLRALPTFDSPVAGSGDPDGNWVGIRLRYWCLAYNTKLVKKEDLPKDWDGFLTDAKWHNGAIGVGDRPQLWLLMIEGQKGRDWTQHYVDEFFGTVKPQFRKEDMGSMVNLLGVGEYKVAIPAADYNTKLFADKGMPVSWYCPEPIPLMTSEVGIMKDSPHMNASYLFVNWLLSKEGQVTQFYNDGSTPVHKDLQSDKFLVYPQEIIGKKVAFRDTTTMVEDINALMKVWTPAWQRGAGK